MSTHDRNLQGNLRVLLMGTCPSESPSAIKADASSTSLHTANGFCSGRLVATQEILGVDFSEGKNRIIQADVR